MEEGLNRVITRHQTTHTQIQLTDEPLPHLLQLILTTPPTEPLPHSLQLILTTPTHSLLYIHIDWFVAPQPCILTIPVAGGHPTHRWPPNTTADSTETL